MLTPTDATLDEAFDDTTLIAYVDGELDPSSCAEVEAVLAADAGLRDKVRALRESTALIGAAFNHALYAPPTEVGAPAALRVLPSRPAPPRPSASRGLGLALAASLVALLVGVFGGYVMNSPGANDDEALRARAFRQSIDKEISGTTVHWQNPDSGNHGFITPIRTFQNRRGHYCREFEETRVVAQQTHREGGITCRQNGDWQVQVRFYPDTQ